MVQGHISFSRNSRSALKAGQGDVFQHLDRNMGADRLPVGVAEMLPQGALEIAEDWLLASIERKRARLVQISVIQRERIEEFVELLFDENSNGCGEMVDDAFLENGDPQKVVEILLEPAARIIGENWCTDACDFLKVTIAVSRMQRLFRRMTSEHPPGALPDLSRCALLTPAPGEQHTSACAWSTTPSAAPAGKSIAAAVTKSSKCSG